MPPGRIPRRILGINAHHEHHYFSITNKQSDQVCPTIINAPKPYSKTKTWLTRYQCKFKYPTNFIHNRSKQSKLILSSINSVLISLIIFNLTYLVKPQLLSSDIIPSNIASQRFRNSNNLSLSQVCGKSDIPPIIKTEGAVLSSDSDTDLDCTLTFRTKISHQFFVIRFEDLRLSCNDHLKMTDADTDYGQRPIKVFTCQDTIARTPIIKTTGSYLTIHYTAKARAKTGNGFKFVLTAYYDVQSHECPVDYALCRNGLCISKSLFCDGINHCTNNFDEEQCSSRSLDGGSSGSLLSGDLSLANALGLLVVIVLIIFACVILFISAVYCRREDHYAQQYQHHLQRAIGVPLQTSSSLMFTSQQPQYHYFQPANFSPYVTPQHHAAIATSTLPRGFSAVPVSLSRQAPAFQVQQPPIFQGHPQIVTNPASSLMANNSNSEYMMMTRIQRPAAAASKQPGASLPQSQSILATGIPAQASMQDVARSNTLGRR